MTHTLNRQASFKCSYLMILMSTGLGIVTSTATSESYAAIYKCVGFSGDTTYSSTACADDESSKRISNKASALASLDCRVARKFAASTSKRMMAGESSDDLFESYGGLNVTSSFALSLISYVYTFEGKQNISINRLTSLSTERCESGSFGPVGRQCDAFPSQFIEELGGCIEARGEQEKASTFDAATHIPASSLNTVPGAMENTTYALPQLGEAHYSTNYQSVNVEEE